MSPEEAKKAYMREVQKNVREARKKTSTRGQLEQNKAAQRDAQLLIKYGMSEKTYQEMLVKQGWTCAICKKSQDKNLCVDHCHTTGKVRALLCSYCNAGLGQFFDRPELLREAAKYLEQHKEEV